MIHSKPEITSATTDSVKAELARRMVNFRSSALTCNKKADSEHKRRIRTYTNYSGKEKGKQL